MCRVEPARCFPVRAGFARPCAVAASVRVLNEYGSAAARAPDGDPGDTTHRVIHAIRTATHGALGDPVPPAEESPMNHSSADQAHRTPTDPPPDATTTTGTGSATTRPGWTEIGAGVAVFLLMSFGGIPLVKALGLDPVVYGLILTAWSGIAGIVGFVVASSLRIRSLTPFGVRRTSWRWLAIGVAGGLIAFVLARLATLLVTLVVGTTADVQKVYTDTGAASPVSLVLTLLFIAVLTPIGEELLFRGVVANALLRYGKVAGILGSAVVFAAVHGPNLAMVTAVIVGLIDAELFRRSGSIWPGVVVHAMNNLIGIGIGILIAGAA